MERTRIHSLPTFFTALRSFLTGGKSFHEIELFAQAHKIWLKRIVGMGSIPSHEMFNRIFQTIKAKPDKGSLKGKMHKGSIMLPYLKHLLKIQKLCTQIFRRMRKQLERRNEPKTTLFGE